MCIIGHSSTHGPSGGCSVVSNIRAFAGAAAVAVVAAGASYLYARQQFDSQSDAIFLAGIQCERAAKQLRRKRGGQAG